MLQIFPIENKSKNFEPIHSNSYVIRTTASFLLLSKWGENYSNICNLVVNWTLRNTFIIFVWQHKKFSYILLFVCVFVCMWFIFLFVQHFSWSLFRFLLLLFFFFCCWIALFFLFSTFTLWNEKIKIKIKKETKKKQILMSNDEIKWANFMIDYELKNYLYIFILLFI